MGGIVGFVENDGNEVSKLFVADDNAFAGIGRALLQAALAHIARSGATTAYLESTLTAAPFYEKIGFRTTGQGFFSRTNGSA